VERIDPALAGACGAWCGGCLAHRGELAGEAAALLARIRRQGFLGLARRLHAEEVGRIDAFFDVLDQIARTPACPGCGHGGGVVGCPVRACARDRGQATCAGCGQLDDCVAGRGHPGGTDPAAARRRAGLRGADQASVPFSASQFLERLTRKYGGWNLQSLRAIAAGGLDAWLSEMASRPDFRTVEVKADEDVFGDD